MILARCNNKWKNVQHKALTGRHIPSALCCSLIAEPQGEQNISHSSKLFLNEMHNKHLPDNHKYSLVVGPPSHHWTET